MSNATVRVAPGSAAPRPRGPLAAIVRVLGVRANPQEYRLEGSCEVGKATTCHVVIPDPTVSRTHARFELLAEGVRVVDLESTNGTFYLGHRVSDIVLGLGSRIQLGTVTVAVDADVSALSVPMDFEGDEYRGAVGRSPAMRRLFAMLERLEGSLATVLLDGESGSGKEVIARAIHAGSRLSGGPLVVLNCGGLPRDLVASELFGHRRGAFTGATDARRGAFEAADGGTLFLDEIGELPIEVQPALLRALESGEIRPVGVDVAKHVNVRIIAATNRDLKQESRAGRFREDLYYRLAVVKITVPPLRSRREDVAMLAALFAKRVGLEALPPPVVEALRSRSWPGNARELRNAVQSYAALGVLPEDEGLPIPTEVDESPRASGNAIRDLVRVDVPFADQKEAIVETFTVAYLEKILEHAGGNQTAAAKLAGMDRTYLTRLIAKHGLQRGGYRDPGRKPGET